MVADLKLDQNPKFSESPIDPSGKPSERCSIELLSKSPNLNLPPRLEA